MRLLTPVLFLLFTLQIDAQFIRDYEREKREQFLGEAWYANPSLRVNVSALANTLNGGLGFVFEYPFHQKWSAEVEAGPILYSSRLRFKGEKHQGIRLRASVKYFLLRQENHNFYAKLTYKHNEANGRIYELLLHPSDGFQEWRLAKRKARSYGGLVYLGYASSLGAQSRLVIDLALGAGIFESVVRTDSPLDFVLAEQNAWLFFSRPGSRASMDLSCTIQAGFYFTRQKE